MESTSQSLAKAKSTEKKSLAKAKISKGISTRACLAKAITWELESAKALPKCEGSISEASLP